MDPESRVLEIKGVGEKTAALFKKAGIGTVRELLFYYPKTYETFEEPLSIRQARLRDHAAVYGVLTGRPETRYVKKYRITTAYIGDEEGSTIRLTWFNMPYLANTLSSGSQYVFKGKLEGSGTARSMSQPQIFRLQVYEDLKKTLQPVYPLVKGLTGKMISDCIRKVLSEGVSVEETLPDALLKKYSLAPLMDAVREIHFPENRETFEYARHRLVFEEFYRFLIGVRHMKEETESLPNSFYVTEKEEVENLIARLPYSLTNAQSRVLSEIISDLKGPNLMNRLVQGDVGSGKTIVAFLSMYLMALCGYQSVLMAPTEVLAIQHYENLKALSDTYGLGLFVELLTGSMTQKEKKEAYGRIGSHQCDIVIGTHAVIQKQVHFEDLGLVITDEQHRFGVGQRKALSMKGGNPHVLVMSATPIPRTLGMILYGDLDISVMDELPKNRLPIKNALVDIEYRPKAWKFIENQVRSGHQAYVICPMVEESEGSDGENVESYRKMLDSLYPPDIKVGLLHGRMKNEEKEAIMQAFSENGIQVLVSTTVIEVGIDVPNATVIMIENAERFGLAQLHQLRGRVGRGKDQSYCILVDTTGTEESKKRLEVLKQSNDGFFIASEDLKMRGPGDFFGIRQSGDILFRLGDIYTDAAVLQQAEEAVKQTDIDSPVPGLQAVL